MEKKKKVSVYFNDVEKEIIVKKSKQAHLSTSEYLRQMGLGRTIKSDQMKSTVASVACQIYCLANIVEDDLLRDELKNLGGRVYGALED